MKINIGFPGLLGLLFVALKLTGVIAWSWWWVTAPFWLPFAAFLSFGAVMLLLAVVAVIVEALT